MSLYKDASLVMIPSAYKDGKLYSIRPTDGSGDFTFSRGSNLAATRVDVNGLIEKGRENVLLQSNSFLTTWTQVSISPPTSGQAGYDGSTDAWYFEKTGAFGRLQQSISTSGVQTLSVYLKAKDSSWVNIEAGGNNTSRQYFDLNAPIETAKGSSSNIISSSIEDAGDGWKKCSITYEGTKTFVFIFIAEGNGQINGTSGSLYIQDSQLEIGLAATDYIESGATTGKAGLLEDEPRFDYSGGATCPSLLLEPSRTNVIEYSEYFGDSSWLKARSSASINSDSNSVEGVKNSYKLFDSTDNGTHIVYNSLSQTIGQTQAFSVFAKQGSLSKMMLAFEDSDDSSAIFDLTNGTATKGSNITTATATLIDDGWYRCSIVFTSLASIGFVRIGVIEGTSRSYLGTGNGSILIYGAQVESGSYPTSYIPTYGTSQTRSKDSCLATSIRVMLIGQTQGTIFVETLTLIILKQDMIGSGLLMAQLIIV